MKTSRFLPMLILVCGAVPVLAQSPSAVYGWACGQSGQTTALGVAEFLVSPTASGVVIMGLDAQKTRVAQVEVKTGPFVMADDWAEGRTGDARNVDGRNIDIEFRGVTLHHESEGYYPLDLPLPTHPRYTAMHAFLDDPHVQPVLNGLGIAFRRGTTAFAAKVGGGEVPYDDDLRTVRCGGFCGGVPCGTQVYVAGVDVLQWCSPGRSTNPCDDFRFSRGASVVGDCDNPIYPQQSYAAICCSPTPTALLRALIKACVPAPGGVNACGVGGAFGCAVCFITPRIMIACEAGVDDPGEDPSCGGAADVNLEYAAASPDDEDNSTDPGSQVDHFAR